MKKHFGLNHTLNFFALILVTIIFSACAPTPTTPAPTAPALPTTAPTALATSTLAPTTIPTSTSTPLPTLTPTITPTPAPDSSAALALARTQIKNFNDKDFSISATWLADKRALVVIQSKTANDAWVLLPGAKEFLRVPPTAADGKISLARLEVEPDGTLVGYTPYSDEMVRKPSGGIGPKGETKFYWTKWQGKEQWLTALPINEDLGGTPQDLLTALSRPTFSRGAVVNINMFNEADAYDKNIFKPFPSVATVLELGLKHPDVVKVLEKFPLNGLVHGLAGVEVRHLSAGWTNPSGREDYRLEPTSDGRFILVINDVSLIPSERTPYGGGGSLRRNGEFNQHMQRFLAALLVVADHELELKLRGIDPRMDVSGREEMVRFKSEFWDRFAQMEESGAIGIKLLSRNVANYIKLNPLADGQVFADGGKVTEFLRATPTPKK
ncbi:MAG: hypothetical protein HZC40_18735 [Chloroflexi bacterium]|nr:hypothetical protein [Chloroflexota bacterium]